MKIGDTYKLNDAEIRLVGYVTRMRIEYNQKTGARATVYTNESLFENNRQGYGGEVAFCRLANVFPDTEYTIRSVHDAVVDGHTVDVKTTRNKTGVMYVKKMHHEDFPEYYAQMVGDFPEYTFMGYVKKEDALQEWRVREFPQHNSSSYVIEQNELKETFDE